MDLPTLKSIAVSEVIVTVMACVRHRSPGRNSSEHKFTQTRSTSRSAESRSLVFIVDGTVERCPSALIVGRVDCIIDHISWSFADRGGDAYDISL